MDASTEQAIDWMVRLDSGHATDTDRQGFAAWLAQAPAHQQAWAGLRARLDGSVLGAIDQLRGQGAAATLGRHALAAPIPSAARRRRVLRGGLAAVLASTATAWLVDRQTPLSGLSADLRTATGERRAERLPDGSALLLNARSAVDIAYGAAQRLVRLREGAVIATVAPQRDGDGAVRPFVVQSAQGSVQALGTRFLVRQDAGSTLVHVLAHSVRISTLTGRQFTLAEGHSAVFTEDAIRPEAAPRLAPAAWSDGLIDVRDQPLSDVVDALRPYQAGLIRVSPAAARLRIFGVFALDRPDEVLQDLVDTHPLTVRRWGRWLTLVDLRAPA